MLWKHAAQGDERAYMTVKNVGPGSLTTGYPACLALAAASFDGTNAFPYAGSGGPGFCGVAFRDIPPNSYGAIQTWGPTASILLSNVGSSITINLADPLLPGPAGFFSGAPAWLTSGFRYVIASNLPAAVSASAYCSGYIRAI